IPSNYTLSLHDALPILLGFSLVPEVGEVLHVVSEESTARKASDLAASAKRHEELRKASRISLEDMFSKMKAGEVNELRLVLKARSEEHTSELQSRENLV